VNEKPLKKEGLLRVIHAYMNEKNYSCFDYNEVTFQFSLIEIQLGLIYLKLCVRFSVASSNVEVRVYDN